VKPSISNPIYSVIISKDNVSYDITNALVSLEHSEQEKQIAASASMSLYDVDVDGTKLSSIISPGIFVVITADDGEKKGEVFRGYVWDISPKESMEDSEFSIKCYDQLIYWQESEDALYFPSGKPSQTIIESIAKQWGIQIDYKYYGLNHGALALRGCIADFITADILDHVQKYFGLRYVIRCEGGKVVIKPIPSNTTAYTIEVGNNASEVRRYISMNGLITQVKIATTDEEQSFIEGTISGETDKYGTLQKVFTRDEDMTLPDAKKEAENIITDSKNKGNEIILQKQENANSQAKEIISKATESASVKEAEILKNGEKQKDAINSTIRTNMPRIAESLQEILLK
jgi:vacuolar-type H+-ATPase subunit H